MKSKEVNTATFKTKEPENPVTLVYLVAYNGLQFLGWLIMTYKLVYYYANTGSYKGMYKDVQPILNVIQTAAVLEIFNAVTGIVRSNPIMTGFQVMSRLFITWHVYNVPVVHDTFGPPMFLLAWGITEVIRYLFYFMSIFGTPPFFLQWCRYTFFYFLYPLGVTGELCSVWFGMDYVQKTQMFSLALPNIINFAFNYYYVLYFIMALYIPEFPQLYFHMIRQRKKVIGGAGRPKMD